MGKGGFTFIAGEVVASSAITIDSWDAQRSWARTQKGWVGWEIAIVKLHGWERWVVRTSKLKNASVRTCFRSRDPLASSQR